MKGRGSSVREGDDAGNAVIAVGLLLKALPVGSGRPVPAVCRRKAPCSTFAISMGVVATTTCVPTTSWRWIGQRDRSTCASRFRGLPIGHRRHRREGQRQDQRAPGARATRAAPRAAARSGRPRAIAQEPLRHASFLDRRHHARGASTPEHGQQPVQLNVAVREVQPIQLRYGVSYDTERGVGGIFDLSNHNMLGKARVIGFALALRRPAARSARVTSASRRCATGRSRRREAVLPRGAQSRHVDHAALSTSSRRGASIQQERELGNSYVWNYGFRYERAHSFDPAPGGMLDESARSRR